MKRHLFRNLLLTASAALLLANCAPVAETSPQARNPSAVHVAPREPVNLTPTRDVISPPGNGVGLMPGADPAAAPIARTVRVGLLLPLTGRSAELGKALQDAATISLFDKYARLSLAQQSVRVELLPKDTGDSPEQATRAMQEALADGAELIIGPVFGPATEVVAPLAKAKAVPVISFTNDAQQASDGVYVFGFSPEEQTARVLTYAQRAGKGRIAALVPNSASGELVLDSAHKVLAQTGATLVAEAKYAAQGVGIQSALMQLMPPPEPLPTFDSLLLPEGGASLGTLLRALSTRGVTQGRVQMLGTGLWDEPTLLRRVSLDGAWLASSPPKLTAQFEQRFLSTYGYVPPRIASLSYDAVALAVTLATSGRPLDNKALTQSAGYSGPANGIFRFRPNGQVERGLAVLQVEGARLTVIDPAPSGFTTTGVPR